MRIAHVCLAAFYIDGYGYQENILPRVHLRMGHDVKIIASTETYVDRAKIGHVQSSTYVNEDGITVHRLPYARWVPRRLRPKIRAYKGLWRILTEFKPDLIFLHDIQFWDILIVRRYAIEHNIRVNADSHTDFINSARGFVSHHLLHGILYKFLIRRADSAIHRYFPTLPARADFLQTVYGLSQKKMELLPFGFDDTYVRGLNRTSIRQEVRDRLGIPAGDIVLVTGGKLDLRKNIHVLIDRFSRLRRLGKMPKVHLLVFGQPNPDVKAALDQIEIDPNVRMLGWVDARKIYTMFWAADLAVFPGTHSVIWEEAIGHGLGAVFHQWRGMEHLDLGGNAIFIDKLSPDTLDQILIDLMANNGENIYAMADIANSRGPRVFVYSEIARKALA